MLLREKEAVNQNEETTQTGRKILPSGLISRIYKVLKKFSTQKTIQLINGQMK
jgi:hypothetical protein